MQPGGFQQYPQQYPQTAYAGGGPWGQGPQARPERPGGVTVLALLGMFGGGMMMLLAVIFGVAALALGGVAATSHSHGSHDWSRDLGGLLAAGGVVLAVVFFVGGLIGFFIARGLWNQRNWARVLYIVSCGFSVLSSLLAVVGALTSRQDGAAAAMITTVPMAALYVWIIAYLMKRDVAATFS